MPDSTFTSLDAKFAKLVEKRQKNGEAALTTREREFYLVWSALGLAENGGIEYVIENSLDLLAVADAFESLEFPNLSRALREAEVIVSKSRVRENWQKLHMHLQTNKDHLQKITDLILSEQTAIEAKLARLAHEPPQHPN